MNDLQIFNNPQFGEIRVVQLNGEPWFVAADVCRALEIGNPTQALARLDDDEKNTVILNEGIPGNPNKTIVSEPGLYSLVLGYTFDGTSKELQAIFMLDNRTVQHEQRITALEESMVVDYEQQRTLATQVNTVVINALGGVNSTAYGNRHVRSMVYSECNRDIQKWFRVNSRNNIPRKRFDEAIEYIQRWRPSTNMAMIIQQANQQTQIYN